MPFGLDKKTLENLLTNKDLNKAETIAVLKAAEDTKEFKALQKKEPGKHHVIAVQLGNDVFTLEEEQRRKLQQPANPFSATTLPEQTRSPATPAQKKTYEKNMSNMILACTCGQTHNAQGVALGAGDNSFQSVGQAYDPKGSTSTYNPQQEAAQTAGTNYATSASTGTNYSETSSGGNNYSQPSSTSNSGTYGQGQKKKNALYR
ncbi:MAG: hypothetical protein Q7R96_03690 [Nanoarchaeota archaeon]|nr:hypothetical protein [Nanoarchaeota archaeon]